jgi:hypothetical protein
MCQFYTEEPQWSSIAQWYDDQNEMTVDKEIKEQFWNDPWYGGPLYTPVKIFDDNGNVTREIPNNLETQLDEAYSRRKGNHGLFILKQISIAPNDQALQSYKKHFYDVTIWLNDVSSEDWERLTAINNTAVNAETHETRYSDDYKYLLNGWAQVIYYKMRDINYFNGTTKFDPRNSTNNIFERVFEGQLDKGDVKNLDTFGRSFKVDHWCKVGYFSHRDSGGGTNKFPELQGKGIEIR